MSDETVQSIDIDHETIGHILADRKSLRVPENQRSYAWKRDQVKQLFQDFAPLPKEYFLGSVIVVAAPGSIDVHDGQQRIATAMILIGAIRDCFLVLGDDKSALQTENDFLWAQNRRTHEILPRFTLNIEDNDYFVKRVLRRLTDPIRTALRAKDRTRESHDRIHDAAAEAEAWVKAIIEKRALQDQLNTLHTWLDFIENSARVIWVQVADEKTAFTIFETMNDRGLKLSAADLLKNCLYARAEDRKQEALQKWQAMTAILETIEDEDEGVVEYLRYYWICREGFVRSKDLYEKMKTGVTSKTSAIDLAVDLEVRAGEYAAILNASHETWAKYGPDMKNHIRDLRILGVRQIRPILMAAMRTFNDKELVKLFRACINWSVRCLLSGVPSGTLESYYSETAKNITAKKVIDVSGAFAQVAGVIPPDDRFAAAVAVANVGQPQLARYYLRALQITTDASKQYGPFDSASVTLEHVLPKDPKEYPTFSQEEAKANLNRLGNLALLEATENNGVGSEKFSIKKPILAKSEFSLTSEIGALTDWNIGEINARQERLAKLAVATWPLKV